MTKPSKMMRRDREEGTFSYQNLEPRRLLAVDIATNVDFTTNSDLIAVLSEPVPMQERFDVLKDHLGLQKHETFRLVSLKRDDQGFAHLKHQQYFNGVKVDGGEYTVHIRQREVVSVSGNYVAMDGQTRKFSISHDEALKSALNHVNANRYIWEDPTLSHQLSLQQLPEGELTYVRPSNSGAPVLSFKFDIYAVEPLSRDYLFVDANSGDVIQVFERVHGADVAADGTSIYNGTVDFTADSFGGGYRLRQSGDGVETFDLNNGTEYGSATDITSSTTSFTTTDVQTGVQAHYGAEQTLQFFSQRFGRDSYDDQGSTLLSYVSYSTDYVNAFWDGSRMTYGDGDGVDYGPLVSLDIVGHEIAHGVTQFSAGLIYQNESGALNESFSDIFGESVENFALGTNDWLMGDDIGITGSGAFRSMSNPNAHGDPDTYLGDFWFTGTGDNGGVHTNSGVQNKWFHILTVGETGTNDNGDAYSVAGLGIEDASAIAYRNLTVYLTASSDYYDAREGAIQSAIDLFGMDSTQHLQTAAAWDAVGVYGTTLAIDPRLVLAEGAGIYHGSDSDRIAFPGTVDSVSFDFDAGQNLTLIAQGSDGLVPTLELRDPNDVVVGSSTTTGFVTTIENYSMTVSGTYTINISGDAGTVGEYQLDVLMNASAELESLGIGDNNTQSNSQNLDGSSWEQGSSGDADRLAVRGFAGTFVGVSEDFESGTLDGLWSTASSHADGRILVTGGAGTAEGSYALFMDQSNNGNFNLNEAVWTVDVSGLAHPVLRFHHAEWSDETHALPATFTGSEDGDGVAISDDGVNWYTILTDTDTNAAEYHQVTIDLVAAATSAGMTLGSNFRVKFQQYDNYSYSSDGRGYDEISITDHVDEQDWFSFSVDAGQAVSLAATATGSFGSLQVDLYDSAGNLLETGVSADNVDSHLSRTNSGAATTWYAKVEGNAGDFTLVATREAVFDIEPNDTVPQELGDLSVLGFVSNFANSVVEPDSQVNESVIDLAFPGVFLSNSGPGGGSIYSADATGYAPPTGSQVFAPGPNADNGFRDGDDELRADFSVPVSQVSIDVGSDDGSDVGFLRAFDADGNLLEEVVSAALSNGQSETLTITRVSPDIAYVISAGVGGDITPLDNLYFDSTPNDDFYNTWLSVGDQVDLTAYLPGQGPYLFRNGLDVPGDSQLRVELLDPTGTWIDDSNTSISHIAALEGNYQIRVYAAGGAGEYFIDQAVNRAPVTDNDAATVDEDNLVNVPVLANDFDPEGTSLTLTSVTTPSHGTALIKADGTIDYKPVDDYFGSDSFEYTVEDEDGLSSTATVSVTVTPVNDAPTDLLLSENSIAENTDTSTPVEIGLLDGVDVDSSTFSFGLVAGVGDTDNDDFEIVGNSLRVKAGTEIDYETVSQYSVRIEVSDGELTYQKQMLVDVIDRVEVSEVSVGGGTQQRSDVRNLVISFDTLVTVGGSAFTLMKRGAGGGNVSLSPSVDDSSGHTVVTLTFNGSFVENSGSLYDGNYELLIDAAQIQSSSSGEFLDGDLDGTAGGDYRMGDQAEHSLYRFFGDVDGDRVVSSLDLLRFRQTYGKQSGDARFDDRFDSDGDGVISSLDLLRFRQNFGDSLDFE